MRKPIKIKKCLVNKASIELKLIKYNNDLYTVKEITLKDIYGDSWLNKRKKAFNKMLKDGHIGLIVMNQKNKCVAYGWVAIGNVKPSHIPRIPVNSAWLHYDCVKENYRRKGLHRILMQERIKLIREKYGIVEIYIDTSEGNIPSRINQKKVNFSECGIYYTIEIGTRRIPFLHLLLGIWHKKGKHPKIIKNTLKEREVLNDSKR